VLGAEPVDLGLCRLELSRRGSPPRSSVLALRSRLGAEKSLHVQYTRTTFGGVPSAGLGGTITGRRRSTRW
jgi:hypothetical protein